jgi:CheY-like chemotaxis protein
MPNGGQLTISAQRHDASPALQIAGECIVVSVADTGIGIPANVLGKVFEPFFSTKPVGRGTGLGLSQVYGFAKQSGGTAHIRSEPGVGTMVDLYFPSTHTPAEKAAALGEVPTPVADSRPRNILVVEDDPDVRRVIVESLGLLGHHVSEAADGQAGLVALRSERPDLMVVDYAMPGMTGAELIAHARQEIGDIPVILATGYADMAEVGRVLGTQSILIKPFQISTLAGAVNAALHHLA